ncbi:DUF4132 domain-containing protein [Nonomuraea sp. ATR24]|uniref:DUF4132 domain-containing protein n=1 Tax=Nonomuraea sp. ATR24 TaxID=1676744 RepID=UPI0035BF3E27
MIPSLDELAAHDREMAAVPLTAHDVREKLRDRVRPVRRAVAAELREADHETCRRAALALARLTADDHSEEFTLAFTRSDGWSVEELTELCEVIGRGGNGWHDLEWIPLLGERAAAFPPERRAGLWAVAERLIDEAGRFYLGGQESRLVQRALAPVNPEAPPLPLGLDGWGALVRAHLGGSPAPHLVELVEHLAEAGSPRPTKAWRARAVDLLAADGAAELVAAAVRAFDGPLPAGHVRLLRVEVNSDMARGFAWAAVLTGVDGAVAALVRLAEAAAGGGREVVMDLKLAGAAVHAMAECDGAVEALRRLQRTVRSRALHKQIDAALTTAAARDGITAAQLVERAVPAHGLAADGTRSWRCAPWTVTLAVEDARTVRVSARSDDGTVRRSLPGDLGGGPELAAEIKAVAKEVRRTLSAERARLESLFTVDRSWPYEEWARHYRDHPITGAVTRALIWQSGDGEPFLPGGSFLPGDSEPVGDRVRLWHPARASLDEVREWRETVTGRQLRQPFKQAFREVYLLTPAELETSPRSERFAAHLVVHDRLYALVKERGWQAEWLHHHDEADARKELAEGAWRARFRYVSAGREGGELVASTGAVRFERRAGRRWAEAALAEAPPLVFSEAMRDVDLFVAVTSIGADPGWSGRGGERHRAYWRTLPDAELPPSAEVRRDALARILPRTAIAGRCELADRQLIVRGDLRTYRIHLSSGAVFMEPGDVYLCVVARRATGRQFLPFEEDGRLAEILSKAFLLARDSAITDESILRQIRP